MADGSKIEWTDATWQIMTGCSVVSPGCTNCYAMRLAGTRLRNHPSRAGLTHETKAGPVWTGETRFNEQWLTQPLAWSRPRQIFVAAHGDLFHEGVKDAQLDRVFAVMALCPQHTFQVLTKRSARMRAYLSDPETPERIGRWQREIDPAATCYENVGQDGIWPLPNVWLGVSAEDQRRAAKRIPDLLATPAAVRWVSAEPLLGPVDLSAVPAVDRAGWLCPLTGDHHLSPVHADHRGAHLDWIVVGGESGPGARPMHPQWARDIRDQCAAAGVAFHFKQWGAWAPYERGTYKSEGGMMLMGGLFRGEQVRLDRERAIQIWDDGSTNHVMAPDDRSAIMLPIGKKAAGRLLDGIEHNAMPQVSAEGARDDAR